MRVIGFSSGVKIFLSQRVKTEILEDPDNDIEIFDHDEDYDPSFENYESVRKSNRIIFSMIQILRLFFRLEQRLERLVVGRPILKLKVIRFNVPY
jgi:hypothetical protein